MTSKAPMVVAWCLALAAPLGDAVLGASRQDTRAASPEAGTSKTVWDGVFTDGQVSRGKDMYRQKCSYCHRDDLMGASDNSSAPPLRGSSFTHGWRERTVAELFLTIGETMPQSDPGSLSPQECIDIISYVLNVNGAASGDAELPVYLEELERIIFTDRPASK